MQGAARATTKGTSIRLRKGLTHYRWCGPGGRYLGGLRAWVTTPTPFVRDSLARALLQKAIGFWSMITMGGGILIALTVGRIALFCRPSV